MGHDFETRNEITVDATPEQVWEAIATGPGIDSWFMGRTTVEPRLGGRSDFELGGEPAGSSTITAWDPPNHFAFTGDPGPDGSFHAFEYLVEGRDAGSTVVRWVHSGFIGHDDWEHEYDALRKGDPMYLGTLLAYLTYYRGRFATPISAWAPPQPDADTAWGGLLRGLGLSDKAEPGDQVQLTLPDGTAYTGVVDSALVPSFILVRTDDALLKFVGGGGHIGVGHHIFSPVPDEAAATDQWQRWLTSLYV
jgi:uncharacterized protein YndB with AHSA1/START domain